MGLLEVYGKLDGISLEDFKKLVGEKIDLMGGLCDETTAALLVAHDLGYDNAVKIGEISGESEKKRVTFSGAVRNIFEGREFSREDGSVGRVVNIIVADETGSIKVALWDEFADLVKTGDLLVGGRIRVNGYVKKGSFGVEVSVGRSGSLEITEKPDAAGESKHGEKLKIEQIKPGMVAVNLVARVLESGAHKSFRRRDGREGKVASLILGDETGKIRLVLWDDRAVDSVNFKTGDVVEIKNAYSRESFRRAELHIGGKGEVSRSTIDIKYVENIASIGEVEADKNYNVTGEIVNIELPREFTRSDGSRGRVLNIKIRDESGEARVALWEEKIDEFNRLKPSVGKSIKILDCYSKTGFDSEIELSAGKQSRICPVE